MLYRAWSEGWGPKFYRVGVTRRITHRARMEWQREREAAAAAEMEERRNEFSDYQTDEASCFGSGVGHRRERLAG